ncbi:MAG TPA: hypothetical protein PKE00_14335, partial [Planctomycetota bacterium]|nr:hypothetical protein [Planctomycetota bacterium]
LVDPKTGKPRNVFAPHDDVGVRIHVKNGKLYEPVNVAVALTRKDGTMCMAVTSQFDDILVEANEAVVTLVLPNIKLLSGEFVVPIWLLDAKGVHRFHELPCRQNLIIQNRDKELGIFKTERRWQVEVLEAAPSAVDARSAL